MSNDFRFHIPTAEAAISMARPIQRARFLAGDMSAADAIRQACHEIEQRMGIQAERPPAGQELQRFRRWMTDSAALIDMLSFPTSQKSRIGLSLLHLSQEHQDSICELMTLGLVGSALALLRPQFEACLRGTWVLLCATDDQADKIIRGKEPPTVTEMAEDIGKVIGPDNNLLGMYREKIYKHLHDFTHGGAAQIKARNTATEITSDYSEEGMIWLMTHSAILGAFAGGVMFDHTQKERGPAFTALFDSIYGNH